MSAPTFIFAFVLSTLIGAAAHLIFGGDARRLAAFLVLSWVGFAAGQFIGTIFQITLFAYGTLNLFAAIMGSITAVALSLMLTARRPRKRIS
jgi:uncharacterized membrane protein YeaQ/YmgE (transglycosylase-associated protein family)